MVKITTYVLGHYLDKLGTVLFTTGHTTPNLVTLPVSHWQPSHVQLVQTKTDWKLDQDGTVRLSAMD
jgi:hypothetical protein